MCCSPWGRKESDTTVLLNWTDAEAPIIWLPDAKSWLTGKDPDAGKDWRQKRVTEDEMVGWHHWFSGHELGQTLGDGEGQGGLACCSPCSCKQLDTTWWLNNNKLQTAGSYQVSWAQWLNLLKSDNSILKGLWLPEKPFAVSHFLFCLLSMQPAMG